MADQVAQQDKPCQCGCGAWHCWLQSWSTPGGNLVLLSWLTVFLLIVTVFLMIKFGPAAPAVMFLVPVAGGFAVAITTRMGISPDAARSHNTRAADQPPSPTIEEPKP